MKENTHITVVLDKSGSMGSIKNDTIGGFNTFLKGQQETAKPGDTFSLIQFADGYHYTYKNHNIKEVPDLSSMNYIPGGSTALLLTLTHSINELGAHLKSLPEEQRPGKVIFVILTDGEENASNRTQFDLQWKPQVDNYTKEHVKSLITEQTHKYSWEFIFLGANQDAIQEGSSYGIQAQNSMRYAASAKGMISTFDTLSRSMNFYKSADVGVTYAAAGGISEADRVAAMAGENVKDDGHKVTV